MDEPEVRNLPEVIYTARLSAVSSSDTPIQGASSSSTPVEGEGLRHCLRKRQALPSEDKTAWMSQQRLRKSKGKPSTKRGFTATGERRHGNAGRNSDLDH
jgi:hypothetical protein